MSRGVPWGRPAALEYRYSYYPDTRASPVGHEVRGHWRYWHIYEQCRHEWASVPDELGRFACALCRGWRTKVKPHRRGADQEEIR